MPLIDDCTVYFHLRYAGLLMKVKTNQTAKVQVVPVGEQAGKKITLQGVYVLRL